MNLKPSALVTMAENHFLFMNESPGVDERCAPAYHGHDGCPCVIGIHDPDQRLASFGSQLISKMPIDVLSTIFGVPLDQEDMSFLHDYQGVHDDAVQDASLKVDPEDDRREPDLYVEQQVFREEFARNLRHLKSIYRLT